ncbi:hypothetical protein GOV10_00680 [Candidatus Woesearchaeota archaeon]|nr:hypothetical protein [Candidatus Woesearchaeota archaeon]
MHRKTLIIILASIFALGIIIGFLVPSYSRGTLRACSCGSHLLPEIIVPDGEKTCNQITTNNPVFFTLIFNIYSVCPGQEIIVCEGGEKISERVEKTGSCKLALGTFMYVFS